MNNWQWHTKHVLLAGHGQEEYHENHLSYETARQNPAKTEEIAYLLRSPKNTRRLIESIAQLENGKGKEKELME